jgi:hypothetical protein
MLSRTLSLATVTLMIAGFPAAPALAQNQNLEAGKSPSQIFAGTCTACHKGPRGLLKTVSPSSLQGFLRQHYTTSPDMASLLAGFLVSNGAADTRRASDQPKSGKPNPDGMAESGRQGHGARRSVRSEEPGVAEGQAPAQVSSERGIPKQKLSKRAKPGAEEAPKAEAAKTEAAKPDSAKEEPTKTETGQGEAPKSETANEAAKSEGDKSQGNADSSQAGDTKPDAAPQVNSGKSESAGIESPSESSKSQTPASASDSIPSETAVPAPATGSVPVTSATTEPAAAATVAPSTESARPSQAIAISAPPSVAPAGPPLPPISR